MSDETDAPSEVVVIAETQKEPTAPESKVEIPPAVIAIEAEEPEIALSNFIANINGHSFSAEMPDTIAFNLRLFLMKAVSGAFDEGSIDVVPSDPNIPADRYDKASWFGEWEKSSRKVLK